jgi:uncharacterized membrane protein YhhN
MKRHTNLLVYGVLLILSGIMIFLLAALLYPALTFQELFLEHPFFSWAIPLILIIIGINLIKIELGKMKDE